MIVGRSSPRPGQVAGHYDELDRYYRAIWGEHVHHGFWRTGAETPEQATRALVQLIADRAQIAAGTDVCDVGCGYGATARLLTEERGAQVVGLTISRAQFERANGHGATAAMAPSYLLRSWLDNDLDMASFDAVIAIESLSHMPQSERAFAECARVLRPGGRLVVCDWLTRERPNAVERRLLLEPICEEGRLAGLATISEYAALIESAGLLVETVEDISDRVWRTWTICIRRALALLRADPAARGFLLGSSNPERRFALTMVRIPMALRLGAMRLAVLGARKPL